MAVGVDAAEVVLTLGVDETLEEVVVPKIVNLENVLTVTRDVNEPKFYSGKIS